MTYANIINYILFHSILTSILCMFYVPLSIAMIAQSEEKNIIIIHTFIIYFVLITRILCFIAVILNTLYAFNVL